MNLNAISTLTIRSTLEGEGQTVGGLKRIGDAHRQLAVTTDTSAKRSLSMEQALQKLQRRYDVEYRAQQELARVQRTLDAARAQGLVTQQAAADLMQKAIRHHNDLDVAQKRATNSAGDFANTLTRRFVFGFVATQMRTMVGSLTELNRELARTGDVGRLTGIGGQQIQGLQSAAAVVGIETGKFLEDMTQFGLRVRDARSGVGDLAGLLRANGVAVKDTGDAFLRVSDLVKNAKDEMSKFSILQQAGLPATAQWVKLMEQGAPAIERAAAEAKKFSEAQLKAADELDRQFNELWDNFIRRGKLAIVTIFGTDWSAEDKLAEEVRKADELQRKMQGISVRPVGPTVNPDDLRKVIDLEQRRIGLLGETASVSERVRAVENQITLGRMDGTRITQAEAENLKRVAHERELGVTAIRQQGDAERVALETMFMSTEAATAYTLVQNRLNEARRNGQTLTEAEIETLRQEAAVVGRLAGQRQALGDIKNSLEGAASGFVSDLAHGIDLMAAMATAADRVGQALINAGTSQVLNGVMGGAASPGGGVGGAAAGAGLSSIFGGLGAMGGPAMLGLGIGLQPVTAGRSSKQNEQRRASAAQRAWLVAKSRSAA